MGYGLSRNPFFVWGGIWNGKWATDYWPIFSMKRFH